MEGEGRVLVTPQGKFVLALGRPTSHVHLAGGVRKGFVFTKLEDNNIGDNALNNLLKESYERTEGLFVMEGEILFYGTKGIPLEFAVGVEKSKTSFRGGSGTVYVDDREVHKVTDGLVPITTVKGYRKDIVPFLVDKIKNDLGIKVLNDKPLPATSG